MHVPFLLLLLVAVANAGVFFVVFKPWRSLISLVPTAIFLFVAACEFRDRLVAWRVL